MKFKEEKTSLVYRLRRQIFAAAVAVVGKRRVKFQEVVLEHPAQPEHGDYSTNIAMRVKRPPAQPTSFDIANAIVNALRSAGMPDFVAKIEVASPGFINIWLPNEYLSRQVVEVIKKKNKYGGAMALKGKKVLLEHTSPNPQTTIMLGHLRNNFLGMAAANILEFLGAKVTKDCIVNDRGAHICKALFGYLVFADKKAGLSKTELKNFKKITNKQIKLVIAKKNWRQLLKEWVKKKSNWLTFKSLSLKPDHANLIWYVLGSRAYELSSKVRRSVEEILLAWEAEDKGVWQIWQQILDWSAKGYEETYKRVGSVYDWVWHESDHYKQGKDIVALGLKKGVFRKSEGAIVTDLDKYSLPDTVVVKADGTALYITQDLALTKLKISKFPSDFYIWCIGEEQTLYFKQLFAVCDELGWGKRKEFFHLGYALINFKGGRKMATRRGDIVIADEILDELHHRALEIIKSSNQKLRGKLTIRQLADLAQKVAVGALKYSLLKFSRETTIYFDIDESLALEGNSGPYLQYTYARCQSVLRKATFAVPPSEESLRATSEEGLPQTIAEEELALLRTIYKFPEVILAAGEQFAPNLICNFLFDLAQKYNLFYNRHPILHPKQNTSEVSSASWRTNTTSEVSRIRHFRLALTAAVGQIIKNGLRLLGIEALERM